MNRVTSFNLFDAAPKMSWTVPGSEDDVVHFVGQQARRAIATGFREKYKIETDGNEPKWQTDEEALEGDLAYEYLFGQDGHA